MSTTAGEVIATEDLVPEEDGVVEGTGPDGTNYRLDVPALALTDETTISLRALSPVAIPGGQLVAGVELEPSGTTFALPVTLTITPASGDPSVLVPFQYTGAPDAATAVLALVESIDADSQQIAVQHFSGLFEAVPMTPESRANWEQAGPRPKSNLGPAAPRVDYFTAIVDAAKYDLAAGVTRGGTTQSVLDGATADLYQAKLDLINQGQSPISKIVDEGNLADAGEFRAQVGAIALLGLEGARKGNVDATSVFNEVFNLADAYLAKIAANLDKDAAFQSSLSNGYEDVLDQINEIASLALGVERQEQLLGREGAGASALTAKLWEWLHKYGLSMSASCLHAPFHPQLAMRFARLAAMQGDNEVATAAVTCALAGAEVFPPSRPLVRPKLSPGQSPGAPQPPDSTIDHISITGHVVTPGLSSGLGKSFDGQRIVDITVDLEVAFASVGGIEQMTLRSGTYTITGIVTGDCVGSGSESGPMTTVQSGAVLNAAGNISVGIAIGSAGSSSVRVNATFSYPAKCSSLDHDLQGNEIVKVVDGPDQGTIQASGCALTGTDTSCQADFGSTWSIQFVKE